MCILIHLSGWKEEKVPSNQLSNADNENETYFTNITSNLQAFQLEMSKLDLIISIRDIGRCTSIAHYCLTESIAHFFSFISLLIKFFSL
jgi:hypothetical protein